MSIDSYAKIGSYLMTNNLNLQFLETNGIFHSHEKMRRNLILILAQVHKDIHTIWSLRVAYQLLFIIQLLYLLY